MTEEANLSASLEFKSPHRRWTFSALDVLKALAEHYPDRVSNLGDFTYGEIKAGLDVAIAALASSTPESGTKAGKVDEIRVQNAFHETGIKPAVIRAAVRAYLEPIEGDPESSAQPLQGENSMLRRVLQELLSAAQNMPRRTPAPGGASTEHPFQIMAAHVWANDRACEEAAKTLAFLPAPAEARAVYPPAKPDREQIARVIWDRFAPSHNVEFSDDRDRAEYLLAADFILALPPKAEGE